MKVDNFKDFLSHRSHVVFVGMTPEVHESYSGLGVLAGVHPVSEMLPSFGDRLTTKRTLDGESVDGYKTTQLQTHLEVSGSLPNPKKAMK